MHEYIKRILNNRVRRSLMASCPSCPQCGEQMTKEPSVYGVPRCICNNNSCNYTMPVPTDKLESLKEYIKKNPKK
jgi:hypothetical protein